MCNDPIHSLLTRLPKVEHHVHLEGTLSPALLFSLALKNTIALPSPQSDPSFTSPSHLTSRYQSFTSLDDFLHYYYIGFSVLCTPSDFEDLSYAYLITAARQGVRHAEVFFDPQGHMQRGVAVEVVVEGWERAVGRAKGELGITAVLVPCLLRHLGAESAKTCFDNLLSSGYFSTGTFAGLGLCSTEINCPPKLYREIFALAKKHGIQRTAHAGEEGPAEYVASALEELDVSRIDHGITSATSPLLLSRLATNGTLLTICPLSNVSLKVFSRISDLPIRAFLDARVPFSINSDDPAYFGGYIQENYCAVQEAFGMSMGEWEKIVKNAVQKSWCGEERKAEILHEVDEVFGEHGWGGQGIVLPN